MVDFPSNLGLFPAVFEGRVSVPCRLIQTLHFCDCVSVDRTLTVVHFIGEHFHLEGLRGFIVRLQEFDPPALSTICARGEFNDERRVIQNSKPPPKAAEKPTNVSEEFLSIR